MLKKLLIICGPTATGKTKLGIKLAKKFSGEIVSADSRQVYKGMDVGTGKELPINSKFEIRNPKQIQNSKFKIGYYENEGIRIWLTDVVEPDYKFNVADYKKCADIVMEDIWRREKLPIIVGGTGFYIKALTEEIETIGIKPDWELRDRLQSCKVSELQSMLRDYNPERSRRMNESDRQNPRRLIRAIEIAQNSKFEIRNPKQSILNFPPSGGIPPTAVTNFQNSKKNILFIGLTAANEILYQRIDQRVEERVKNGIEEEIKILLEKGYNWENSVLGTTIAYKEWKNYFNNNVGAQRDAPIQKWKFDEYDYAGRQMTWFRKNKKINWFDITKQGWEDEVELLVNSWYS